MITKRSILLLLVFFGLASFNLTGYAQSAESASEQKADAEQIRKLTEQIKLEPKRSMLYAKRGQCYVGLEEWAKALDDTNSAIEIQPNYSPYYVARAGIYNGMKNPLQ